VTSIRASKASAVMVPRQVLSVQGVPLLATGKPDYPAVKALAEERLGQRHTAGGGTA
jgi:hypothetical protein